MSFKEELQKAGFVFKKKFGQNFIFDANLLGSIILQGEFLPSSQILEIGPGAGALTRLLCKSFEKVVAYEIDETLKPVLQEILKDCKNVEIVFDDILKADIKKIESHFADANNGEYHVVANLPYYITTPIIFKFLTEATKLKSLYVMVQKEVADRIVAAPKTKDYGVLSISVQARADVKIAKNINRKMFFPVPNVDSAMVKITLNKNKFDCCFAEFDKLVGIAFSMRRKTLVNNLSQGYKISKESAKQILAFLGFAENVRGEQLCISDYIKLLSAISNQK